MPVYFQKIRVVRVSQTTPPSRPRTIQKRSPCTLAHDSRVTTARPSSRRGNQIQTKVQKKRSNKEVLEPLFLPLPPFDPPTPRTPSIALRCPSSPVAFCIPLPFSLCLSLSPSLSTARAWIHRTHVSTQVCALVVSPSQRRPARTRRAHGEAPQCCYRFAATVAAPFLGCARWCAEELRYLLRSITVKVLPNTAGDV